MVYTVRQLANVAGVSVRTLHHYDHIGLLKPSSYAPNGYRHYGEREAVLLQQILFFRELGFSLKEIGAILSRPDFDVRLALESHRTMLRKKAGHIAVLLETVDKTIKHLEGERDMKINEYYEGLSDDQIEEYRKEARQRWGADVVNESESRVMQMGKDGFAAQQTRGEAIFKAMAGLLPKGPASPEVQEQVRLWRDWLECFSSYSDEAVLGLGRMYSEDARFVPYFGRYGDGFAAFLTSAIEHYCSRTSPTD
jgi:MerR family transcriptional regulator, thiopeptide resistance regulator